MRKRIATVGLTLGILLAAVPITPAQAGHQGGGICFFLYKIFGGEPCGE